MEEAEIPVITPRITYPAIVARPDEEGVKGMKAVSECKLKVVMMSEIERPVFEAECSKMVSAADSKSGINNTVISDS